MGTTTDRVILMTQLSTGPSDKRAHPRVRTHLRGRYTFSGKDEYPCTVTSVAPGGIALLCPQRGSVGQWVVVYIDQLGRVEGKIARIFYIDQVGRVEGKIAGIFADGFAVRLSITTQAVEKFARRIGEIRAAGTLLVFDERRRELGTRRHAEAATAHGPSHDRQCTVIDISAGGASVATMSRPPVGSLVQIGTLCGRVVRHSPRGVAIEFIDTLEDAIPTDRFTEIELSAQPGDPTALAVPARSEWLRLSC